jgi:hypothetical protein
MSCLQKIQNFIPGGGASELIGEGGTDVIGVVGCEGARNLDLRRVRCTGVTGVVGCVTGGGGSVAGGGAVGVTSCVGGGVA